MGLIQIRNNASTLQDRYSKVIQYRYKDIFVLYRPSGQYYQFYLGSSGVSAPKSLIILMSIQLLVEEVMSLKKVGARDR